MILRMFFKCIKIRGMFTILENWKILDLGVVKK